VLNTKGNKVALMECMCLGEHKQNWTWQSAVRVNWSMFSWAKEINVHFFYSLISSIFFFQILCGWIAQIPPKFFKIYFVQNLSLLSELQLILNNSANLIFSHNCSRFSTWITVCLSMFLLIIIIRHHNA
jgi:hypothetical protein